MHRLHNKIDENLQQDSQSHNKEDGENKSPDISTKKRQPKLITGCEMRDYQLVGLEWLVTLYENALNGILADEMVYSIRTRLTLYLGTRQNASGDIPVGFSLGKKRLRPFHDCCTSF